MTLAIEAAGGVGPLARKLGISQPSVSGWSRVPADRVAAVEAATGIERARLRPDLYASPAVVSELSIEPPLDDIATARQREYLMLAQLLSKPPRAEFLAQLAAITGDPSPLGMAHIGLAEAAARATEVSAGAEYFNLFVGVGRGELLPYTSFYLTGFLNERPLARVREDLRRLGVQRQPGVYEPEDHLSTLFEVMAGIVGGEFPGGDEEASRFFSRHIKPWAERLFVDLAVADSAQFYKSVAEVGRVWIEIETEALEFAA